MQRAKDENNRQTRYLWLGGALLNGENEELWRELCEQAAKEQGRGKLIVLIAESNRLLDENLKRLRATKTSGRAGVQ